MSWTWLECPHHLDAKDFHPSKFNNFKHSRITRFNNFNYHALPNNQQQQKHRYINHEPPLNMYAIK